MAHAVARLELDPAQQKCNCCEHLYEQGRASLRNLDAAEIDENKK